MFASHSITAMRPWFAKIYDTVTKPGEKGLIGRWRAELVASASGQVLEIGAGTGHNLAHYPRDLDRLVLTEPSGAMRSQLEAKLAVADLDAEVLDAPAYPLPFGDETFDTVVCTLVLCSVPDVDATLAEARRVLRPGGRFLFLEHVLSADKPRRQKWQRRLEPAWLKIEGSCHLARPSGELIKQAGFDVAERRGEVKPSLPVLAEFSYGTAVKPAA